MAKIIVFTIVMVKPNYLRDLRMRQSYFIRHQTHNKSALQLWGGRTHDHSLVCLFSLHHLMNHPGHRQEKREPLLCSATFYATFLNKNGGLCKRNNGHQTPVYLLHVMATSWKQCFNMWSLS